MKHLSSIIFFLLNFLIAETPFKVGESLKYSADFNLIRVGQAELNVIGLEKMNDLETYHVNINEGNYTNKVDVKFDYQKSIAKTGTKEVPINFKARDSFSMFYYLRTIPLKKNEIMSFSSFEGKRIVHYNLQMTGTEIVRTNLGTFNCKVIRPYREGKNLFKNQGDMQIWISDDSKRLPIKIQIKMKFGSMTLLLKNVS